jgi:hypothetical protein
MPLLFMAAGPRLVNETRKEQQASIHQTSYSLFTILSAFLT